MGPQKHQSHISVVLLAEKEERINNLESQVNAYMARTSYMQARLFSTLDALDASRSSHAQELASETRAKEKLSDKLDRYIDFVEQIKNERDDLRDAVIQLVQKDPITQDRHSINESDQQLLTYASALIASLRAERDIERRAHKFTRQHAESRISELEAQLARREAQLESCVAHADICFKKPPLVPISPHHSIDDRPMIQDEMVQALNNAYATKNKALEVEVKGLVDRLEMARSAAQLPYHEKLTSSHIASAVAGPAHAPIPSLQHMGDLPSVMSGGGLPPKPVLVPGQSHPRTYLPSVQPIIDDPAANTHPNTHPELRSPDRQAISDLRHEIAELAAQVDAFKAERDILSGILAKERQEYFSKHSLNAESDLFDRMLLIEKECTQLRNSEGSLLQALEAANLREDVLREEIERLRRTITIKDTEKHLQASRGTSKAAEIPHLIDEYDGEMSMDLASPLHPTSLLPSERNESQYIDPPSVPLPQSPVQGLTHFLTELPPDGLDPPFAGTAEAANLKRVEEELDSERRRLEGGENALSELRGIVEGLQRQIVNGAEGCDPGVC